MKKFTALLLAAVLATGLLTACGNGGAGENAAENAPGDTRAAQWSRAGRRAAQLRVAPDRSHGKCG